MIYLKELNIEDIDEEYKAIKSIPPLEGGFRNKYYDVSKEDFKNIVIPKLINCSKGIDVPNGHVPDTYFFLWDDKKIVGLCKIRHYLNDNLKHGAGHFGLGIIPQYRKKGYGKQLLSLSIEKGFKIVKDKELYLSVSKLNPHSIRMQLKNNAYIVGETKDGYYLTRIKPKNKNIFFYYRDLMRDDLLKITDKKVVIDNYKSKHLEGKVSLIDIKKMKSPLIIDSPIGKITYANNGYKHLMIAPKNKNYWITAIFNKKGELIESCFDFIKTACFDVDVPYFIEMKLSVAIPKEGKPKIMGKQALKEVYRKGMIKKSEYDRTFLTANKIISYYKENENSYYENIYNLYYKLKNKKEL